MIILRRPSDADLDHLIDRLTDARPTFDRGQMSQGLYSEDQCSRLLRPTTTWDRARHALQDWGAHRAAGVRVRPLTPPMEGQTVALALPIGPMWALAACRVTLTVDAENEFGFTYATLPVHPEEGEESFVLRRGPDDQVRFHIEVTSRPVDRLARLGGPITRAVQHRVTGRYLDLDGRGTRGRA